MIGSSSNNPSHYSNFSNNWNPLQIMNSSGGEIDGPGYSSCFSGNNATVGGSITAGSDGVNVGISSDALFNVDTSCLADVWSGNEDNSDGVDDWSGEADDPGSC